MSTSEALLAPDARVRTVVSVVTYRAAGLTLDCLGAIAPEVAQDPSLRVVVVDNASGDGTAEAIETEIRRRGWSPWCTLLRSPVNGGFAAGNNLVFRLCFERYPCFEAVVLLNPDTVARRGAIGELKGFLDLNPQVGLAGGRCEHADGTPQECAFRFPNLVSEFAGQLRLGPFDRIARRRLVRLGAFDRPVRVGWVSGALMIVRRQVLEQVGLMDEGYFLYYEETDYSLRALRAGWPTWHVPASRAMHLVGRITGVDADAPAKPRLPAYWYESRRRYFVLNHGVAQAVLLDLVVIAGTLLWRFRRLVERKPDADPQRWLRDLVRLGVLGRGTRGLAERRIR